jgi:basic amino acid/polyamine antiporter, APA family
VLRRIRLDGVPVAGSAYTFSYATLGEFVAWIIGWDLVLELALGASVVAKGWSLYLGDLFSQFGGTLTTSVKLVRSASTGVRCSSSP